jgi:geranylgeranyl transferase type-2 subunit beta
MSLVSGPGRGGTKLPSELELFVEKHVRYIQTLDSVCLPMNQFARGC